MTYSPHNSYIKIGNQNYHLTWVSSDVMEMFTKNRELFDIVDRASRCLRNNVVQIGRSVNRDTPNFPSIVFWNYLEIALGIDNAQILLRCGSLADSLTLLRPAVEYMLDLSYLQIYPQEVSNYENKVIEHNSKLNHEGLEARDPNFRMRFMNISTMNEKLLRNSSSNDLHKRLINQYNLLSNVADHTSPERKNFLLKREQDWANTIGQHILASENALKLLCSLDGHMGFEVNPDTEIQSILDELAATP